VIFESIMRGALRKFGERWVKRWGKIGVLRVGFGGLGFIVGWGGRGGIGRGSMGLLLLLLRVFESAVQVICG
jgi:hypothetical protein